MNSDVLVIGSGISGITFSIKLALINPKIQVILISKSNLMESNTRYAQGGIAVVSDFKKDSLTEAIQLLKTRNISIKKIKKMKEFKFLFGRELFYLSVFRDSFKWKQKLNLWKLKCLI